LSKEVFKGVSWKAIIVGIAILVFFCWFTAMPEQGNPDFIRRYLTQSGWLPMYALPKMFVVMLLIFGLNSVTKKPIFNRKEAFIILWLVSFVGVNNTYVSGGLTRELIGGMFAAADDYSKGTNYIQMGCLGNGMWAPIAYQSNPQMAYNSFFHAVSPDFGIWIVPIIWITLWHFFMAAMLLFAQILFTAPLITLEDLPTPGVQYYHEMTEMTQSEVKEDGSKGKLEILKRPYLWIAFIIGFLIALPWILDNPTWIASNPSLYPWLGGTGGFNNAWGWYNAETVWEKDYSNYDTGIMIAGTNLGMNFGPWLIAWGLLWPWDILATYSIGTALIVLVLGPIFVATGLFAGGLVGYGRLPIGFWWMLNHFQGNMSGPDGSKVPYVGQSTPPGFIYWILLGLSIAVIFYPIWRARSTMGPIIKSLFVTPSKEVEEKAPIPYRLAWIGMIVSLIISVLLGAAAGYEASGLIACFVVWIFFSICIGRTFLEGNIYGATEAGFAGYGPGGGLTQLSQGVGLSTAIGGTWARGGTMVQFAPDWQLYVEMHKPGFTAALNMGIFMPLYGYKMSDIYGTEKREWLLIALIGIVATSLTCAVATVYWLHVCSWGSTQYGYYGATLCSHAWNYAFTDSAWSARGVYVWSEISPYLGSIIPIIALSTVLGFAMYIGRSRVSALGWLNPVGMWLAFGMWAAGTDDGMPGSVAWCFLCLAIRYVSTKIKGPKWTSRVMVEIGVGLLVGIVLGLSIPLFFEEFHHYGLFGFARANRVDNP